MVTLKTLVRQVLLVALGLAPVLAFAEPAARYENGIVVVSGLNTHARAEFIEQPENVVLQVTGLNSDRGMPVDLTQVGSDLHIAPRFRLQTGKDYVLRLGSKANLMVVLPSADAPAPMVVGFEPAQSVVPANILRMYLHFSEPMARGQVRDAISLKRSDGNPVSSPFLTLAPELWDATQTRLTLLIDPGRIKQGVGPNQHVGAPLEAGQNYRIVVDGRMKSAVGNPLGKDVSVAFRAGPAERRPFAPKTWQILIPSVASQEPFTLTFDRIMDTGMIRRLIKLIDANGRVMHGRIETDGGNWSLFPTRPWAPGVYTVIVDPELEDVSGNTSAVPFDAGVGAMGAAQKPVSLTIRVLGNDG